MGTEKNANKTFNMQMKGLFIQFKMFFIFITDILAAFGALFLMLFLRYGINNFNNQLNNHFLPFLIIIALFSLSFYIFNLYSSRFNRNITEFTSSFIKGICVAFFISIPIFYIFGNFFNLTPKINLIIFTGIFGIADFYLRIRIKRHFIRKGIYRKVVIVNKNPADPAVEELRKNQNIGYEIVKETDKLNTKEIISLKPDLVVIDTINKDLSFIYLLLKENIKILTINNFYEEIFQKIPIENIAGEKIVDYINKSKADFNFIKRIIDLFLSLTLIVILSPIFAILAVLIKLTSRGPILFKHKRVSLNDAEFIIYKFRSMHPNAEKNGAVWTESDKYDNRITSIGKFIRKTHLDEIPQLINILKGDISFVGPRPERPEFTHMLNKKILFYDLRHSVKAGLTGWAQVNYKYGASINDAKEKLKFDFYYIKNRNVFFDILIIMKTIAKVFS